MIPKGKHGVPCAGKKSYASETEAKKAIKEVQVKFHHGSRAYFCIYCETWHLTTQKPRSRRGRL